MSIATPSKNSVHWNLSGWNEVVLFIDQSSHIDDFLIEVGGWQERCKTELDPALLMFWNLDAHTKGTERVLSAIEAPQRLMRVLKLDQPSSIATRTHCQAWDAGGIFDLNVRVKNINHYLPQFCQWGWQAVCPPLQFTFGKFEVKEWIVKDPCGITLALIERLSPPLPSDAFHTLSTAFNSTQVVKDFDQAYLFYTEVLQFQSYLSHRGVSQKPGSNVFGLPREVALKIERQVEILHPQGLNEGSIELLSFQGIHGEDASLYTAPPHLGINTLRFPTQNIHLFHTHVHAHYQSDLVSDIHCVNLSLIGKVKIFSVYTPDAVRLEFYESYA